MRSPILLPSPFRLSSLFRAIYKRQNTHCSPTDFHLVSLVLGWSPASPLNYCWPSAKVHCCYFWITVQLISMRTIIPPVLECKYSHIVYLPLLFVNNVCQHIAVCLFSFIHISDVLQTNCNEILQIKLFINSLLTVNNVSGHRRKSVCISEGKI